MNKLLSLVFFILSFKFFGQETLSGKVVTEQSTELSSVLVVNITTDDKTYTNSEGNFKILAKKGDEIRFLKEKYDRASISVFYVDFQKKLKIILTKTPIEIKEVQIKPRLTGNLNKDSKSLNKRNRNQELQNAIGLPPPPEKPREKPAEVARDILLPIITGNLNIQAIYDVASGKAKRQKRLYKYQDLQENIVWVRQKIEDEYFINLGIPKEDINSFIEYSFAKNPFALRYAKAENVSGFLLQIEEPAISFVKILQQKK
ncbi:hypothetical protein GCM10010992_23090 [Cloacibacterium rupense]|uniref:CarboxypepD_reg-like domain-containing protein n=1 Tax=Cloacibacterium rupense TaxID=517423 RepID=A0ABQ2NKM8_9FLAO|nr:carboxypeptidase regulatory-like domain-containing protein [Cloacibacterium rupense]GGP05754.1 hypothetical protein GCM10010992_23090 [Cloacibacterium rupense]